MPQFILDAGGDVAGRTFRGSLDAFTRGYVEALFFTEEERLAEEGGRNTPSVLINRKTLETSFSGPSAYGFADLAPEALERIIKDCKRFQVEAGPLLALAYTVKGYDEERAGADYWFSRNGHGVGFWDRGLGGVGDKLHDACKHRECTAYIGDDGLVHVM